MESGFILLQRKLLKHWIFQRTDYFSWFVYFLFKANFIDKEDYLFNGKFITVKRGQFITSYQNLADELPECTIKKIRTFIKLLEKSKIIKYENLIKGARITICKYDTYQTVGQAKGKQRATI